MKVSSAIWTRSWPGRTRQVVTGADLGASRAAAALAQSHPGRLWSTAGIHPHHAVHLDAQTPAALRELLSRAGVVAVGECGLDYCRNFSPPSVQRKAFVVQLELAVSTGKPVFLHQRDAHADFKAIIADFRGRIRGVAHCFTGTPDELDDHLEFGLSIGVTGWVCDERRGASLRAAVPHIPPERLMIETDAPYLLPRDLRPTPASRRNEPAHLPHIAHAIAALRDEPVAALAAITTRNAIDFFGLGA